MKTINEALEYPVAITRQVVSTNTLIMVTASSLLNALEVIETLQLHYRLLQDELLEERGRA